MPADFELNVPTDSWSNLTWAISGGLLMSFGQPGSVPSKRWAEFISALDSGKLTHILSMSSGDFQIDSVQRKSAAEIVKVRKFRSAVVVDSVVTRGVLTALGWIGVQIKSFAPSQTREALEYLAVPGRSVEDLLYIVERLREASKPQKELSK